MLFLRHKGHSCTDAVGTTSILGLATQTVTSALRHRIPCITSNTIQKLYIYSLDYVWSYARAMTSRVLRLSVINLVLFFCREVRKTCDSEEHADRELLRNITKTWTSLKNLRSYQNCTNTPIKLNFTKWAIYFCFIRHAKGRLVTRGQLQTPS